MNIFKHSLPSRFWIVATTKFRITVAYPFLSLAPVYIFSRRYLELLTPWNLEILLLNIVETLISLKRNFWNRKNINSQTSLKLKQTVE